MNRGSERVVNGRLVKRGSERVVNGRLMKRGSERVVCSWEGVTEW